MAKKSRLKGVEKTPSGIRGLDDITGGGLPRGNPVLVCGPAGSGKTVLAMEFLVRGAERYNEPGLFVSFEESPEKLARNFAGFGFDLAGLQRRRRLGIEYVFIERSEIHETGEYDLEALFIRLGRAIDDLGAKRVVLDTIEALFAGLDNSAILRAELRRLFRWLSERGVTAIITGERYDVQSGQYGLEEFVADCVILLDVRMREQIATRHLRVVKYRGSAHGANEYPFLIDAQGLSILPITSLGLQHEASGERVSSGNAGLDAMLGGKGYFRGSTVLISGTAGSGKSSLAATFIHAACARGERAMYFGFEESPSQILRNMRSIGLDLGRWVKSGLLRIQASRPSVYGLEMHLVRIHQLVTEFKPRVVVVDPISNLTSVGTTLEAKAMLTRLIDFLKSTGITAVMTDLTHAGLPMERSNEEISSLIDTWISLRDMEHYGERNRGLHVIKSRGMAHSNQIREFLLTDQGVRLTEVYLGADGVLMGTARAEREARDRLEAYNREQEMQRLRRERARRREEVEMQIRRLRQELEVATRDESGYAAEASTQSDLAVEARREIARLRRADVKAVESKQKRST